MLSSYLAVSHHICLSKKHPLVSNKFLTSSKIIILRESLAHGCLNEKQKNKLTIYNHHCFHTWRIERTRYSKYLELLLGAYNLIIKSRTRNLNMLMMKQQIDFKFVQTVLVSKFPVMHFQNALREIEEY